MRDLAYTKRWQESLERSRARRGKSMPSASELHRWRSKWDVARDRTRARERMTRPRLLRRAIAKRPLMVVASPAGVLAFALLAAVLPIVSNALNADAPAHATRGAPAHAARLQAAPGLAAPGSGAPANGLPGACGRVHRTDGYINPLANAVLTPKRIDQGVDYAGSGILTAIGAATVTLVATSDTGWPGAFIEYQLADGPAAGCFVFYAEGVTPAADLQVGDTLRAGQMIATIVPDDPSGIEIGWGAGTGTKTYAAAMGEWSSTADADDIPTAAGKNFSSLIELLGGPPGKIEG